MSEIAEAAKPGQAVDLAKLVNIMETSVKLEQPAPATASASVLTSSSGSGSGVRFGSIGGRRSTCPYVPSTPQQLEEIMFAKPTFMERFARYFVIVIYLCGLCSLGFMLSIYHVFFWDSRMPPVYKGQKKPAAFG